MQLQIRRPPDLASQLPYGWEAVPRDLSFELTNVFNWILSSLNGILYREYGVFSDIPLVCSRLFHCFLSLTVGCPYRWCLQWGGREEVWEIPRAVQQSDLINLQATHQSVPDPCTNQRGGLMSFTMFNNGTTNHPSSPSYLSEPTIHHHITKQRTNHKPKFNKAAVWSEGSMPKSCCIVNVLVWVSIIIILYWNTQCFVFKTNLL